MKKVFLFAAIAAITSCSFFGISYQVGNGVSVDTAIEVGEFDAISAGCSIDVIYTQSAQAQSVVLTCDENLVEHFNIRVEDGTLKIGTKPGTSINTRVKSYVTINSAIIKSIKASGSGDIMITSPLVTDDEFSFKVSGSGDIEAKGAITCKDFTSSVSGSGDISVAGVLAGSANFKDSGSGDIKVDAITAEDIIVKMSGSGDITLKCQNAGYIDASLSGSGDLVLSGSARSVQSNITGSGRVNSKNLTILRQ